LGERTTPKPRKSFSKLQHILDLPNLIAVQTESFEWFKSQGLKETIEDINPIEDYTGNYAVEFGEYQFNDPGVSLEECRDKDQTYAAPLFITVRFVNRESGEIREQNVFMGDFPMMTEQGTFIINGTERVIVTQLVRSPGAYVMAAKTPRSRCSSPTSCRPAAPGWSLRSTNGERSRSVSTGSASSRRPCSCALLPGSIRRVPATARTSSTRAPTRRSLTSSTATRSSRPPSTRTRSARSRKPSWNCSRSSARANRPRSRRVATFCGTSASIPSATTSPGSAGTS